LGLEYVDLYLMHWPVPMNPKGIHSTIHDSRTDGRY
jgi:diketogulonate reductase-like aldo/keto reductase